MIQDIYLYFGNQATTYPLTKFCLENTNFLEEHGLYYPVLKDIMNPYPIEFDWVDTGGNPWLCDFMHVWYSEANARCAQENNLEVAILPSVTQLMETLVQTLKNKPQIHSLCFFLNHLWEIPVEEFISALKLLQQFFPSATIHLQMTFLPPDLELEGRWLEISSYFTIPKLEPFTKNVTIPESFLYRPNHLHEALTAFLQENIPILQIMNPKDCLLAWQQWVHIPKPAEQLSAASMFISPEVLTFIQAVQKELYPKSHQHPWMGQYAFFQYGIKEEIQKTYLKASWRKDIREAYVRLSTLSFVYKKELALDDVSDVPLELTFEKALELATLLTSTFRQRVLRNVELDMLFYESQTVRNVYGAILFLEGQLDKEALQSLLKNSSNYTVQNIYLQLGNPATLHPLIHFCLHNKAFLEEQGLYYPVLKDILAPCPTGLDWVETIGNFWLCDSMQSWYSDGNANYMQEHGREASVIPNITKLNVCLAQYVKAKPHIHSLCIFLNSFYLEEDIIVALTALRESFPNAVIHPHMTFLPPDRELEGVWINNLHFFTPLALASLVEDTAYPASFLYTPERLDEVIAKKIQQKMTISHITNEKDSLFTWQQWVNIPKPVSSQTYGSLFVAPEVLAFIQAVQKETYPCIQQYPWFSQDAFFQYGILEEAPKSYLRPFWRMKVQSNYSRFSTQPFVYQDDVTLDDVSGASLGLTLKKALELASLLSISFRQMILRDLDISTIEYQSQSTRNAYGAILFLDGQLDDTALKILTQAPQGICLPPRTTHIEESTSRPKVAVLTMAYNQRDFIEKNIQSVLEQETDFPVTHIISDDASTDGTQDIILEYAAKYPHIKAILNKYNRPGSVVLNLFDQVPSQYVALCDGDDYFHDPKKLQKQVDYLDQNSRSALCFHPVMTLFEEDPTVGRIYPPLDQMPRGVQPHYYLSELLSNNFIQTNSVMYRWRFPNGLPAWYAHGLCPSDRYWHLIHAECGKIGFQREIMSVYRRHVNSHFYQTEVSTIKHRKDLGIQEISLYQILDIHFEEKFTNQLHSLAKNVFAEIATNAAETKDPTYLFKLIERFPMFEQYIKKINPK